MFFDADSSARCGLTRLRFVELGSDDADRRFNSMHTALQPAEVGERRDEPIVP